MIAGIRVGPIIAGALSFVPGMAQLLPQAGGSTASASYCYGVWLKHLALLDKNGMRAIPESLAELGPGDSLGTGLAAVLSGVDHYLALDRVEHSSVATNLRVFDELVELFRQRSPRPVKGWPDFDDCLDARLFPSHLLTAERLEKSLAPARLARIRAAIADPQGSADGITIRYIAPWNYEKALPENSIDLIISHAVLAEVLELERTYALLHAWLKPDGWMSHQIGFEFYGINGAWNGYWACPEALWTIIRGKRAFVMNRQPRSTHLDLLQQSGQEIVCRQERMRYGGIRRSQLRPPWKNLQPADFYCSDIYIQSRKQAEPALEAGRY